MTILLQVQPETRLKEIKQLVCKEHSLAAGMVKGVIQNAPRRMVFEYFYDFDFFYELDRDYILSLKLPRAKSWIYWITYNNQEIEKAMVRLWVPRSVVVTQGEIDNKWISFLKLGF